MEENGQLHSPAALPPRKNYGTHRTESCLGPRAWRYWNRDRPAVAVTIIPAPTAVQRKSGKCKARSAGVRGVSLRESNLCFKLAAHTAAPKAISSSHYHPTRPFISTSIRHTARTECFTHIYLQTLAHTKFLKHSQCFTPKYYTAEAGPSYILQTETLKA